MTQQNSPKLSPEWIDPKAQKIVCRLQEGGFTTYLVGGCVRDLLLGIRPKDYDIATDAHPGQIRKIIPQAYIIGKRFRLVLVKRGDQQFEVATFRRDLRDDDNPEELPTGDNIFGTPEEDAKRRDFTINGMFYDPVKHELIDYNEGSDDLKMGLIRMIGEPNKRLQEDPIRILRAVRLAHKIRFSLETHLRQSIAENSPLLVDTALPRRREEILKFLRLKEPALPLLDCYDLNCLEYLSPALQKIFESPRSHDEFLHYMRNYHDHSLDLESPVELFAGLVLAVVRSTLAESPTQPLRARELLENDDLKSFMKEQLGMFNHEQSLVAKALQLQSILQKSRDFALRSPRRQLAVLTSEAFPLAIKLAKRDYILSSEDLHFWLAKYKEIGVLERENVEKNAPSKRKRKRKRKKAVNTGK